MKFRNYRAVVGTALALAVAMSGVAQAQVTFTKDVLPILQENCQTCHRPSGTNLSGMIAPMSLMSYKEVRPWAKAIVKSIQAKQMPPWDASEKFNGHFRNERTLTAEEIDTISSWVSQGAKRGNAADAPAPIEFSSTGWNLGEPDIVVDFAEPFFVGDDVEDLYHNITTILTEEQLSEDRWISAVEFKPGSEVVHHIIGHATDPNAEGNRTARGMIGGNAPGADQEEFPAGYGIKLKKGSAITFAMHYHKESGAGTGTYDSSQIGIKLHPKDMDVTHPVDISTISYGGFEIPPFAKSWRVGSSRLFTEDMHLIGMLPHMHLRGKSAKYTAFYPDGTSEDLLDVPEYDFNWQTGYKYAVNKLIPAGTRIEMEFYFENSEERADLAGIDPSRTIRFGGPTTDEMDLAWITIAPAAEQTGD